MKKSLTVKEINIRFVSVRNEDFISLTDIAQYKNSDDPRFVVQNWMKTRSAVEFLGLWETINNPDFNRVEFDTFKNESGSNSFVLTPQKWIKATGAAGLVSKAGRYGGGTFAHKDIAFEFASWILAEFKLYIIKEFQRLKQEERERNKLGWSAKRFLVKANYKVHTDAVQKNLIPAKVSKKQISRIYANEADIMALQKNFPSSPYLILKLEIRWLPSDDLLREFSYEKLLPPLVHKLRKAVYEWREGGYAGAFKITGRKFTSASPNSFSCLGTSPRKLP